jgi:tetratricopeptide (TPR) repeat protein
MFYLNILVVMLGLILELKVFHKLGIKGKRKNIIRIIIVILIFGLSVLIIINEKNKEEKIAQKNIELERENFTLNYEIQRNRLIGRGLTDSQIENLGESPLLEQAYNEGQEYERTGNFKEAIESYEEIIKYRPSSDVNKLSAYVLVGNCYFELYELDKAMQNFQKSLDLVEKLKDEKYKSNGKMITFHSIGCVYKELALWKDAQKYLEYSLKESVKLDDDLQKANTLLNISYIYFQLNKPKIAIEKLLQSIQAYQEVLKVKTLENFPIQYAMTQNDLGVAYQTLAEVKDRIENCDKAIQTYQESLKVYTLEDFPMDFTMTQNNLGVVYQTLAEVEDKAENCEKAIQTFQEVLKVKTLENFPIQYAMTQNNLGNVYQTLAEVKDRVENCEKAIQTFQESLKVRTLENFSMQYAMTQYNLGNAYYTLAKVEDKAENCEKAIQAYQESLKVYTIEDFPMQYAMTQNNLGAAYSVLAEVEDKAENCEKAIQAFQEALKVYTKEEFPEVYRKIEENIKNVYEL